MDVPDVLEDVLPVDVDALDTHHRAIVLVAAVAGITALGLGLILARILGVNPVPVAAALALAGLIAGVAGVRGAIRAS